MLDASLSRLARRLGSSARGGRRVCTARSSVLSATANSWSLNTMRHSTQCRYSIIKKVVVEEVRAYSVLCAVHLEASIRKWSLELIYVTVTKQSNYLSGMLISHLRHIFSILLVSFFPSQSEFDAQIEALRDEHAVAAAAWEKSAAAAQVSAAADAGTLINVSIVA